MAFQGLIDSAQKYFPDLQVKYKADSKFMQLIGKVLFFNKSFMTDYITTIGSTVYFPSQADVNANQTSSAITLLHELVHVYDAKGLSKPVFSILYLFPQILALLFFPLLLVSLKVALPFLLFAAPIPAFFRMRFEKRAYFVSLYVTNALSKRFHFNPDLDNQKVTWENQFKGSYYYFMWPLGGLSKEFDDAVAKIKAGQRPYEDPVFDILDDLVTKV